MPNCIVRDCVASCAAEAKIVDELALNVKFVIVVMSQMAPEVAVRDHVPLPIFSVRVPVPVPLKATLRVALLLLVEKSRTHPVVDAVQAPIVMD